MFEELKNVFKKVKWDSIISSILIMVIGIICACMPNESGDVLCVIFGAILLVMGILSLIDYLIIDHLLIGGYQLIIAITMTIGGIFCLCYPNMIKGILTVLFGLYIIIDSANAINDSIECARIKMKGWPVLLILAIVTLLLGIAVMFSNFDTVMIFAGISLIVEGARRLFITLKYSRKIKEAKRIIKDNVIDTTVDEK